MQEPIEQYAWKWFSLHASQRMQMVNFWLVAVSFITAAFVTATEGGLRAVAVGVACIGMLASFAFSLLDMRTRQLIQIAEDALLHSEKEYIRTGGSAEYALLCADRHRGRSSLHSYRIVIQGLQLIIGGIFGIAALWASINV